MTGSDSGSPAPTTDMPSLRRCIIVHSAGRPMAAAGLRAALEQWPHIEILAYLPPGPDARDAVRRHRPEYVLVAAPGVPHEMLLFLQQVRGESPSSRILLFTDDDDHATLLAVRRIPVEGYLLWEDVTPFSLQRAIELTGEGIYVGSAPPVEELVAPPERRRRKGNMPRLTAREESVLLGLDAGLRVKEIALQIHVSDRTVERAVESLQHKLRASSFFQLGVRAEQLGLIRAIKRRETTQD